MVQVQNEPGTYGSVRDFGAAAQKSVRRRRARGAGARRKAAKPGSWSQVFGKDADEFFHAWAVAKFIGDVAAAGKKEYALPMYVNAALRDPFHPGAPGGYASGGPTDNVISIYRAAAPAIDIVAPDIYMKESTKVVSRHRAVQGRRAAAGARDRQRSAVRALLLRRARRAGDRHRALRHGSTPATRTSRWAQGTSTRPSTLSRGRIGCWRRWRASGRA